MGPDDVILEQAEFRVRPGGAAGLEAAFADSRHLLLRARGCHGAVLLRSVDHQDTYLLQVRWERLEDHIEVFSGSPEAARLIAAIAPHSDGPPRVVHYDAS
jgi:heme-degrading monooxygenase HmoA